MFLASAFNREGAISSKVLALIFLGFGHDVFRCRWGGTDGNPGREKSHGISGAQRRN